ncbi:hypothetical protein, partial [Syntrophomonas palmitatica]|uniref:hypothetical protein n=1 Tax=Syntrophomonas palmitatica TaxID=402877 RepID=UPI0006D24B46
ITAAIVAGVTIVSVWEGLYLPLLFWATHTTILDFPIKPWLYLFYSIPELVLMVSLYILVKKYRLLFIRENIGSF